MRYSVLLFDADETLLDFRAAESKALRMVFSQHGLPTDGDFIAAYHRINDGLWDSYNRGEIQKSVITSERFTRLFAVFSVPLDGVEFNERYLDCLSQFGDLLPGAAVLCEKLYAQGRALYIITNGIDRVQRSRFAACGLAPYFRGAFVSEAIGVGKPHRAYFDAVLAQIGIADRSRVLVIGDSLRADIEGGAHAGLDTCWCDYKCTNQPNGATYRVENFAQLESLLCEGSL